MPVRPIKQRVFKQCFSPALQNLLFGRNKLCRDQHNPVGEAKPGSAKLLKFGTCPKDVWLIDTQRAKMIRVEKLPPRLMGSWWVSWKPSTCVAVSWDALVLGACAALKATPDGERYISPGKAEWPSLCDTRALLVSQTSCCKPPAEIGFFCRTSRALAEGGGRSNSASPQSEKIRPVALTSCCSLICC